MADVVLCRDCRHYRHNRHPGILDFEHGCARKPDLVTGGFKINSAHLERDSDILCGQSGQYFVPKIQEKLDVD